MIRFAQLVFYPKEERHLEEIRRFLKTEWGLVSPNPEKGLYHKDKLVWEDQTKTGRYRVDFLEKPELAIGFRYWGARINPEINKTDPMLEAILKVAERLPTDTPFNGYDLQGKDVFELRSK